MCTGIACLLACLTAITSQADDTVRLPLTEVVMFDSGLSYFQHEGQIVNDVDVELSFDKADINDLLKSLVVQVDKGQITTVDYPSPYPIAEQLAHLAVDMVSEPTLGELIHQLRGTRIQLDGNTSGTIVGVELKSQEIEGRVIEREMLTLLTEGGLRAVALDSVNEIRLLDRQQDQELRQALDLLQTRRVVNAKPIRFHFTGEGGRTARIGYIRATPIWKTSYRVVLGDQNSALLQGWAIVENTSESDWTNVRLTLASGQPVTFRMDLYRPLLVERPLLKPSVPKSLASRIYHPPLGKLDMNTTPDARVMASNPNAGPLILGPTSPGYGMAGMGGMGGGGMGGMGMGGMGGQFAAGGLAGSELLDNARESSTLDASLGVTAQVTASEIGEQFQYRVANPVSLPQRHSAMLPIIDQQIHAPQLSIFTVEADQQHPRRAFRLHNTSDLKLVPGPITVLDQGVYAGDACIEFVRPGEQRLVSYAQDLNLELRTTLDSEQRRLRHASVVLATVSLEFLTERARRYRIQNKSDEPSTLILEQPCADAGWNLRADQKATETTDSHYRFEVPIPEDKTIEFVVVEERTDHEQVDLRTAEMKMLEQLSRRNDLPDDVVKTIQRARALRMNRARHMAELQLKDQLLRDIAREQSRIRSNMSTLSRDGELYQRYVAKLTRQEDNFDRGLQAIAQLRIAYKNVQQEMTEFFPSTDREDQDFNPLDPLGDGRSPAGRMEVHIEDGQPVLRDMNPFGPSGSSDPFSAPGTSQSDDPFGTSASSDPFADPS